MASSIAKLSSPHENAASLLAHIGVFAPSALWISLVDASRVPARVKMCMLGLFLLVPLRWFISEAVTPHMDQSAVLCVFGCSRLGVAALAALANLTIFISKQLLFLLLNRAQMGTVTTAPCLLTFAAHSELSRASL